MRFLLTHVTKEVHQVWPKRFLCLWYTRHKPSTYLAPRLIASLGRLKQAFSWPTSPRSFHRVCPKWFSCLLHVRLKLCTNLCVEINTISKRIKMSFHLTHVTKEYHRVQPKRFLCPGYIRRKPCTYLALRLTSSPSGLKKAFTWPTSPRCSIGCAQNGFWAYCMCRHKWGTYLASLRLALSPKRLKWASI
jgi:hypothetical protein